MSNGMRDKLTHAGIYGEDASIRTLENLYGIDITYYVRVNFTTLIDIVDAIDGVDVWSDYEFECFTDSKVYINKGWNHLNGRQALAFCRERYSFPDGDNQRGKDQEAVLKAIIEKVTSPALIVNASALLDSMKGSFQTDLPESKIAELINQQLSEGTDWIILRQAADGSLQARGVEGILDHLGAQHQCAQQRGHEDHDGDDHAYRRSPAAAGPCDETGEAARSGTVAVRILAAGHDMQFRSRRGTDVGRCLPR